jgi:hypothetical protein
MPKFTPKPGRNWGIEVNELDENGNPFHGTDGKVLKVRVNMADTKLKDGTVQCLYWPNDHERAGVFKGMAAILEERGFTDAHKLKAQCKDFKCKKDETTCCCCRILYNEPDFVNVPSVLETFCKTRGYHVIFFPKFHCELNFIEQCWGFAKHLYHQYPTSTKEADLEHNVLEALDAVLLVVI